MSRVSVFLTAAMVLSLCGVVWAEGVDRAKLVDLTYELDETTIAWPTNRPFHRDRTAWGITAHGYWYASADFAMSEHAGTHIDAPVHFAEGRASVDRIGVDRLIAPAVVVDVREAAAKDADYRLRVEDLRDWEGRHGIIPAGAIVVMRTGWGRYWPDRVAYLGSSTPQDVTTLHFPGFSPEAAEFLIKERAIVGIGIDTASIDHGPSRDFVVHRIVGAAGVYALENIAHADELPESGATLIALPLKIKDGTGGPIRLVAVLP
ncbi:MAG TPA: cyclase family protein [Nitrospiraceae bacterium]|nr:cyclase family protein [Nitrospiraceae bacterium]